MAAALLLFNLVVAACAYDSAAEPSCDIRDSKALTAAEREQLADLLTREFVAKGLLHVAYAQASASEVETSNLNALNLRLFKEALQKLPHFDRVIIDGTIADDTFPGLCAPRADETSITVATASIFAKVRRDRQMRELHTQYPAASPAERSSLLADVDAAVAASEGSRKASLIGLRGALADGDDAGFTAAMIAVAEDEAAAFAVRVAALRLLLARAVEAAVQTSLAKIAALDLEPARQVVQASELLGSLALQGLRADVGRPLVERLALTTASAPRIPAAAYALAALPGDGGWLDASQTHPWPEVRGAALARVEGPCSPALLKKISRLADATRRDSEAEAIVAREAITAFGRCGGEPARKTVNGGGTLGDLPNPPNPTGQRRRQFDIEL